MILRERFAETLRDWKIDLIASDLSSIARQQAQTSKYTDVEVRRGLSDARLAQHFRRDASGWQVDD